MRLIYGILVCLLMVALIPSGCQSDTATGAISESNIPAKVVSKIIKLDQAIIAEGIRVCEGQDKFGSGLPLMRTNYAAGFIIESANVIHNGDNCDLLVTLECTPKFQPTEDTTYNVFFSPTPTQACEWLKPEINRFRLQAMETKVIKVTLSVPESVTDLPKRWAIQLHAEGTSIIVYDQTLTVVSKDIVDKETGVITPDTTLTFHLTYPLLEGIPSILSIKSTIDEQPFVTNYDPVQGLLTVDGLKSNETRDITFSYERWVAFNLGNDQTWFITMVNETK
jgi:hypothetical protein